MMEPFRESLGLWRSRIIYRAPWRIRRLARFYAPFVRPGDLCFDIGAHVGNHTAAWVRLGARVVALEPQPRLRALLARWYDAGSGVTLLGDAVGATPGEATLRISRRTPTVSTLSEEWIADVQQEASFAGVTWETSVTVPVTTLDALIARHGLPAFCKIDVEGYELPVLQGLSQPLPALSFEFVPAATAAAIACVGRLEELGAYEYNWSIAERYRLGAPAWLSAEEIVAWLGALPAGARSGDIYARLRP
jgi:FkbM family methyltransferase